MFPTETYIYYTFLPYFSLFFWVFFLSDTSVLGWNAYRLVGVLHRGPSPLFLLSLPEAKPTSQHSQRHHKIKMVAYHYNAALCVSTVLCMNVCVCVCLCIRVCELALYRKQETLESHNSIFFSIQNYTFKCNIYLHTNSCIQVVQVLCISADYKWIASICKLCKMVSFHQLLHVCTPKTFMYCSVTKHSPPPGTFSPTHRPPFANSLSTIFIYLTSGNRPTMIFLLCIYDVGLCFSTAFESLEVFQVNVYLTNI